MPIPTEQNPMHLLPWEQLLYDAGIRRGRSERGAQLTSDIGPRVKELIETFTKNSPDQGVIPSAIVELEQILRTEIAVNKQLMDSADQLLITANNERAQHLVQKSHFTASTIEAIMKEMMDRR